MADKICGVYKITNLANGKLYVGSSNNIYYRWKQHKAKLRKNEHDNEYLQNAWNKYGENSFVFSIIEKCDPSIQFEREQYYLNLLNPFDDEGYNIVRQISKDYMSDHYMIKTCTRCNGKYQTFSHMSKYCDKCKEEMANEKTQNWQFEKTDWIDAKRAQRAFDDLMSDIYGSVEYFWETVI